MAREYIKGTWQEKRAFSPAVITSGGRTIWLAGQTVTQDENGRSLAGDFEGQTRAVFRAIERTLSGVGSRLQDIVTMTVFITDPRHGDRFVEIRSEHFKEGFPASALITVRGFAKPEMLIEIQAIAVAE